MARRKYIRIALTEDDERMLLARKSKVETETSIQIGEGMFVLMVLRRALKELGDNH